MPRNPYLKPAFSTVAATFAFAALLCSAPSAGAASLPVEREGYSLTFPDGWVTTPPPSGAETSFQVFNPELGEGVAAFGYGVPSTSELTASFWIDTYTQSLLIGYARTDSSEKTLGNYAFTTSEYKDISAEGDPDQRIRIYIATQGDFLFLTWLVYKVEDAAEGVSEFESALATLEIEASARLARRARVPGNSDARGARLDALGRNWKPAEFRAPSLPLFARP